MGDKDGFELVRHELTDEERVRFEAASSKSVLMEEDEGIDSELRFKIEQANRFASLEFDKEERGALADTIEEFVEAVPDDIKEQILFTFFEGLQDIISQFRDGTKTLYDIHLFTLEYALADMDPSSEVVRTSVISKMKFYRLLKMYLHKSLPIDGRRKVDEERDRVDNVHFSETLQATFGTIFELLEKYSNVSGIGIYHVDINLTKADDEKGVQSHLHARLSDETDNDSRIAEVLEETVSEEADEKIVIKNGPNGKETHVVKRMQVGNHTAYIDFVFEGEHVHYITRQVCRDIEGVLDSFLKESLREELQNRINIETINILKSHSLQQWKESCEACCKMLSRVLGTRVHMVYKESDMLSDEHGGLCVAGDETMQNSLVNDEVPLADLIDQIREEGLQTFVLKYPAYIKQEVIDKLGSDMTEEEAEVLGALFIEECETHNEMKIAEYVSKILEDILKRREELRARLNQTFGLRVANAYLSGNMEVLGDHNIAVLIADVVGFSKFTEALKVMARRSPNVQGDIIADIMKLFIERIGYELERDDELKCVVDKIVGDEVIALIGPPFTKDGKDAFDNDDLDDEEKKKLIMAQYLNVAMKVTAKMSQVFKGVLTDVEEDTGIKMPWYPDFSFGINSTNEKVGIFGNEENPYSRCDYTDMGEDINTAARIEAAAPEGGILVEADAWELYEASGLDDFVRIGKPFIIKGKNIQDPIRVVEVMPREKYEEMIAKQESSISERSKMPADEIQSTGPTSYFYTLENLNEFPDGDYVEFRKPSDDYGPYDPELLLTNTKGDMNTKFSVLIPREKIVFIDYPITVEEDEKLKSEKREKGFSNRVIFRKKGDKFYRIKYIGIEKLIARELRDEFDNNEESGRDDPYLLTLDQLPSSRFSQYRIMNCESVFEDTTWMFTLSLAGTQFKLVIGKDSNILQTDAMKNGFFEFSKGLCHCHPETLR